MTVLNAKCNRDYHEVHCVVMIVCRIKHQNDVMYSDVYEGSGTCFRNARKQAYREMRDSRSKYIRSIGLANMLVNRYDNSPIPF